MMFYIPNMKAIGFIVSEKKNDEMCTFRNQFNHFSIGHSKDHSFVALLNSASDVDEYI